MIFLCITLKTNNMDQKQSFNLTTDFLNGFSSTFMKFVYAIILVYVIVLILNFLRDKFINKQTDTKRDDITVLMTILNKLFFIAGFGFIIGNIFQFLLSRIDNQNNMPMMNIKSDWDYLTFGIIMIFIGIGLKVGKKMIIKERTE